MYKWDPEKKQETFVVSGPTHTPNVEKMVKGYVFRTRNDAYRWCVDRYGYAEDLEDQYCRPALPMWAFRVPVPVEPLEPDDKVKYHLGGGRYR